MGGGKSKVRVRHNGSVDHRGSMFGPDRLRRSNCRAGLLLFPLRGFLLLIPSRVFGRLRERREKPRWGISRNTSPWCVPDLPSLCAAREGDSFRTTLGPPRDGPQSLALGAGCVKGRPIAL